MNKKERTERCSTTANSSGHPDGDGFTELSSRALYALASDPECPLPGGYLCQTVFAEVRRQASQTGSPPLQRLRHEASAWSSEEASRYVTLLDGLDGDDDRGVLMRSAALGCAPLALVSGAWLQWLTGPGNADDAVALQVLSLYASDVGVGHPRGSRGSAYLVLLRGALLAEHAHPVDRLASDERVADEAFRLPAGLLAMSRWPDDFRPEILGADLCLRSVGLLPALALVRAVLPTAGDWRTIDPGSSSQHGALADAERCNVAVDALRKEAGDDTGERVVVGFSWALDMLRRWSGDLYAEVDAARDPAYGMAELLRRRARVAAVYHRDYELQGRSLSEWLLECQAEPGAFMRALAASRLVKPGRSHASPLVCGLVGERGPMFRVFTPQDLSVIRRWIDSLPASEEVRPEALPPMVQSPSDSRASTWAPTNVSADGPLPPATLREAYHRLQRRADSPALRRWAAGYVRGWLARSRHGMGRSEHQLPARWNPEGLRPWLVAQHDRHGQEFEARSQAALPSREALIDSTVQLAPLTLIDGSWLQGFTDYEHASSEAGHFLFETYWDELGNGEPRLNHPRIYREVLTEMGVELPPTGSSEFAYWPGFRDGSFELPTYWLSIGRFPQTFLPEVLGLNLAMELSGVGGTYRRARLALKAHGFSTRFVDVHNTIDNVDSGHSAWAADAVDTYLAALSLSHGADARVDAWARIRVGYRSLNPPTGVLARHAFRRARRGDSRFSAVLPVGWGTLRSRPRGRSTTTSSPERAHA